ncbi:MAG TPA: hypothetical protein VFL69_16430 [Marmoricola sp.]|nr:hypothetical protein [Marmoricola sp.]
MTGQVRSCAGRPGPSRSRAATAVLAAVLLLAGVLAAAPAPAVASGKRIGPGVQMNTHGAQCTANFVFRDRRGRTYVGYAAHCAGKGNESQTNGCTTPSYPLGTRVTFTTGETLLTGGTVLGHGRLAYSSWIAMHRAHTGRHAVCAYNDLALVRVGRSDLRKVDPTVPQLGGPTGVARPPAVGRKVYTYGASSLRGGQAKQGTVRNRSRWTTTVFTPSPGIPGDSGSGFLTSSGKAFGVLSTLDVLPDTGANGVGSLALEIAFASRHGVPGLRLVPGRTAFSATGGLPG